MSTVSSLAQPFNHQAVIEGALLKAFPGVWRGVYYFDPRRGTRADEEGSVVFSMIRRAHTNVHLRSLQDFGNTVARAVKNGCGQTIPYSRIACYVMTERSKSPSRLKDFFGDAALIRRDLKKLGRLFEEYVARHETYHSVEMLDPAFQRVAPRPLVESESEADAYALLSMFREHGCRVFPFAELVIAARDHQYAQNQGELCAGNYLTQPAIRNVCQFVRETGKRGLKSLSEAQVFQTAQYLGTPRKRPVLTAS